MKKFILASAIIAASFGAAEAKCSKKSLNGNWMFHVAGQGAPVSIVGGVLNFSGAVFNFNLNDKCKGIGSLVAGGTTYPATIAAEKISPTSSLKPNFIDMGIDTGGGNIVVYSFYRR
jgi:hypothetical protein